MGVDPVKIPKNAGKSEQSPAKKENCIFEEDIIFYMCKI